MEEFVRFAISKNVTRYGFSSHAPLPFITHWNMKQDDFDEYIAEFKRLDKKYADRIRLFAGVESDYISNYSPVINQLFQADQLDYIIGSVHYMDRLPSGKLWTVDGPFSDFAAGLNSLFQGDIRAAVLRYFDIVTEMLEEGGFHIVGHVDKIAMNALGIRDFSPSAKWYIDRVEQLLELISSKNYVLEINTKSLQQLGITYPLQQFYPVIRELNIPVTVNSDCHYPMNVTDGFTIVYSLLKEVGFTSLSQLIDGKWQPVPFNEHGLLF